MTSISSGAFAGLRGWSEAGIVTIAGVMTGEWELLNAWRKKRWEVAASGRTGTAGGSRQVGLP
jgi:hypothetical protein